MDRKLPSHMSRACLGAKTTQRKADGEENDGEVAPSGAVGAQIQMCLVVSFSGIQAPQYSSVDKVRLSWGSDPCNQQGPNTSRPPAST